MRKILFLVVLALVAAACGGDDGGDASSLLDSVSVTSSGPDDEPVVEIDGELSTDATERRVIEVGDGDPASDGASVTFHFVAFNGRTGERFDGTRPGDPPTVTLDPAAIFPGLYEALVDVRVGSRVLAVVAPDDAFGPQGGFADLGLEADDTLVFVIDLLDVTVPLPRAEGTAVEPPAGLPTVTLADDGEPSITLPEGEPPGDLVGQVLIEGAGDVVEAGDDLTVHYKGITWPRAEQFDSSWARDTPASFPIGTGSVIDGWDQTLVGQRVGSQLLLVIPPEAGYGAEGRPDAGIQGTDTLVFVVDILAAT